MSPYGAVAKLLVGGHEINEFEFQLCYYDLFKIKTHGKIMNRLILQDMAKIVLVLFLYKFSFVIK